MGACMRQHRVRSLEETFYWIGIAVLLGGMVIIPLYLVVLVPHLPFSECIFYHVFGIYCPGCGGTRALEALLAGQFLQALWYHPLVPYAVTIFVCFMVTQTIARLVPTCHGMQVRPWHFYGAVIVLIVNWVGKNVLLLVCGIPLESLF